MDPFKALPIQLAAILLDRNDLSEKSTFTSYIKQDLSSANPESLEVSGINETHLKDAPSQNEVLKQFLDKFGTNVLLCSYVELLDRRMLQKMLRDVGMSPIIYDHHYIDLWPVAYFYLLKQGYTGNINSDEMFAALGLPERGKHDALEDCRFAANVLRKVLNGTQG